MRVLIVLTHLKAGGAEVTALELTRALVARGHYCSVAAIKDGSPLREPFAGAASVLHERIARFRHDPVGLLRIARIVRRERIEAVIVVDVPRDGMFYGFVGALLSLRRVRRACWCKSIPGGQSGNFTPALRAYAACGLVHAILCPSRRQMRALAEQGLPRRRMVLIRNGVDLSSIARAQPVRLGPAGKRLIVQVANVMPDKDFQTLIRAAGLLGKRRDDFHLALVGRGADAPALAEAARRAGAEAVVTLVGHRPDVPGVLKGADIFCLSTRSEVFSVAVLEAMAAGLPVVTSDIPGFDEVFTHGREGLKVPPEDAEALAGALARLLDDPSLRQSLGSAGFRRAQRFSLPRMADSFQRVI